MQKRLMVIAVSFSLLLCHCATKHQPVEFAPTFFTRPEGQLTNHHLSEIRALEGNANLSPFEKKRLADLYQVELKNLKSGSARHQTLSDRLPKLRSDVESIEKDLQSTQSDLKIKADSGERPTPVFQNPVLRKEYKEAVQLWNKAQTPAAIAKVDGVLKNPALRDRAIKSELFRFLNLRFRVALESGEFPVANQTYAEMKDISKCDSDTTQAGFLLALLTFTAGDAPKALSIYEDQCDPDETAANLVRRRYWVARFTEPTNAEKANAIYHEVANSPVPGYHVFMAQSRLGKQVFLPPTAKEVPVYLTQELQVSSEVHDALTNAEERLKWNLRKDAAVYLLKAARALRKKLNNPENVAALLYTAHLFSACGNHLEAIRIYSDVTSPLIEGKIPSGPVLTNTLFSAMFPRPFPERVDWLARMWRIDPDFVYAIMRQESAFNPGAVSISDARGLMQLMPALGRSLSKQWRFHHYFTDKILFHAEENLKLGVFHLSQLQEIIPHLALMAASYNAGFNRVKGWWKRYGNYPLDVFVELIPVAETRNYVKLVIRNYFFYKTLRTGGPVDANLVPFKIQTFPEEVTDSESSLNTPKRVQSARFRIP